MSTTDLVHYWSADLPHRTSAVRPASTPFRTARAPSHEQLIGPARQGILLGRRCLLQERHSDGSWCGRQFGDTSIASQLVLLQTYLGETHTDLIDVAVAAILDEQRPNGGWSLMPDAPMDVSTSVQAYFALKISGQDPCQPALSRARQAIRERGGAVAADMQTRWWLALFGQIDYSRCRSKRPDWAMIDVLRPTRMPAPSRGIRELFVKRPKDWPVAVDVQAGDWRSTFLARRPAWEQAKSRLTQAALDAERRETGFQELVWQMVALDALGFHAETEVMAACERRLQQLVAADDEFDVFRPQPATTSRADTVLAIEALHASGVTPAFTFSEGGDDTIELASRLHLLADVANADQQAVRALPPNIELIGGHDLRTADTELADEMLPQEPAKFAERLAGDLLLQQNADGGWTAPHRAVPVRRMRSMIPFSNRVSPASSPDATGTVLEALARHGVPPEHAAIRRGVAYLRGAQRPDGSWDSASGVQFIHGTSWAVRGFVAAGVAPDDLAVAGAANWLLVHQQESGGWGETVRPATPQHEFVHAAATAIQTAWALLALAATGYADHDATRRGVQFLLETQKDDGRWCDLPFTLRDTAQGRWHGNELHSLATPLLALSRWFVAAAMERDRAEPPCLKLVREASYV